MFSQDKHIEKYRDEARQALHDGHAVHTTYLPTSVTRSSTQQWGRMVEAIESEGWRLAEWCVDQSTPYPLFRRAH